VSGGRQHGGAWTQAPAEAGAFFAKHAARCTT
jgi:hypothetical protein